MARRLAALLVFVLLLGCLPQPGIPTPAPTGTATAAPACETHTAEVTLSVSSETVRVGETLTVTARLDNFGCTDLGLPQYRLYSAFDGPDPLFDPPQPEPVLHSLAVSPGGSDQAEFSLRAVKAGQASLSTSASFEVHLGYPGPAYWGYAGSVQPLQVTVLP